MIARAPGRLEFIGNHTDYNGGTVLGVSIDRGVWVAVAPRDDGQWRLGSETQPALVTLPAGITPAKQGGAAGWANYPLGVIAAFAKFQLRAPAGFDFLVSSDLPSGAGLSSSAALELASALAFLELSGQQAPRETVVQLCRRAENDFVGVPCGVLDQGVSGFGKKITSSSSIAAGRSSPRCRCRRRRGSGSSIPIRSTRSWTDYTRRVTVSAWRRRSGSAWRCWPMPRRQGWKPRRATLPPVEFRRAKHVVDEIARVDAAVVALHAGDLVAVGKLLTASHRSSQTLFENSTPELDFLVDQLAVAPRVFGARLTGGGFGGAVLAVTSPEFSEAQAAEVADAYAKKFGTRPEVLRRNRATARR